MKTIRYFVYAMMASVIVAGCSDIDTGIEIPEGEKETRPFLSTYLTKAEMQIADSQTSFCLDIFRNIAVPDIDNNILISPFSISMDMAMLSYATNGATYDELAKGLGFGDASSDDVNSYYRKMTGSLDGTAFRMANALWYDSGLKIKDGFAEDIAMLYDAKVEKLDFKNPSSLKSVNDWACRKTNGAVRNLVDCFDVNTAAVFTNALAFDGQWLGTFTGEKRNFTRAGGKKSNRLFFTGGKDQKMYEYNTWQGDTGQPSLLWIPYKNGFYMLIILPPASMSLRDFIETLTAENFNKWKPGSCRSGITVHVPVFSNDYELKSGVCRDALVKRGINLVFDEVLADFSRMSEDRLFVGRIMQKSAIKVDESGTSAASASSVLVDYETAANLVEGPKTIDFVVDRPFIYAIVDNPSKNTLLYIGTVVK